MANNTSVSYQHRMSDDVTLYHIWPSHCSQKVRLCLAEKGVDYDSRIVNIGPPAENYEPWYARLNPNLVVPTLEHDERVVIDSKAIVEYVDECFEGPELMPEGEEERARVREMMELADELDIRAVSYAAAPTWVTKLATSRRLKQLRRHRDRNPDLADVYERKLEDVRDWRSSVLESDELAARRIQIDEALDQVDQSLAEHDYVAGDRYTLADVLWTCVAARLEFNDAEELIEERPNLRSWYRRMEKRPSFDSAEVWTRMKPLRMLPIVGSYFIPRILGALAVVAVVVWLVVALVG